MVLLSVASSAIHILELSFFISLQEKIDTLTVEGVDSVGEEDYIEIKTEEDYIQLVGTVKCEQEVSVLCCVVCCVVCFVVGICVQVCVVNCVVLCTLVLHS